MRPRRSYSVLFCLVTICDLAVAQGSDIVSTWAELSPLGVAINIETAKNIAAPQSQLVLQRFNEFADPVGQPLAKPLKLDANTIFQVILNSDDLRGARSIRYWISAGSTLPSVATSQVRVDIAALRRPDELRKELEDNKAQSEKAAAAAKSQFDLALLAKDKDIAQLKGQLSIMDKGLAKNFLPDSITVPKDPEVFPGKVGYYIETNRAGLIEVAVRQDNDDGAILNRIKSETISTRHQIVVPGLASGETFRFEVRVLNFDGSPYPDGPVRTFRQERRLRQQIPQPTQNPVISIDKIVPTHNALSAMVSVDKASVVTVILKERKGTQFDEVQRDGKPAQRTVFGMLENNPLEYLQPKDGRPGERRVDFKDLKPETEYQLQVVAVDSSGQEGKRETTTQIVTAKRPPDFEFNGSVELDISPLGFTATWEATSRPTSGNFEVVFKNGGPLVSQPAAISGNKLTASLPADKLADFYKRSKEKTYPKDEDKPILRFKMGNEDRNREASIKIAYTIPSTEEVNKAASEGRLSADDKKKITDVISKINENKGFKWQELLTTGIGIVLKFL